MKKTERPSLSTKNSGNFGTGVRKFQENPNTIEFSKCQPLHQKFWKPGEKSESVHFILTEMLLEEMLKHLGVPLRSYPHLLRPSSDAELFMSRTEYLELSTRKVRRLNQLRTAI